MAKKEVKTNNNKENNKNKKSFFKGFKAELKKVVWPTPKQLINNTIAVITIVLITAAIVFILDLTFEAINKNGIDKIKQVINTTNSASNNSTLEQNNVDDANSSAEENVDTNTSNENVENNTDVVE